jgi:hypothetical protein
MQKNYKYEKKLKETQLKLDKEYDEYLQKEDECFLYDKDALNNFNKLISEKRAQRKKEELIEISKNGFIGFR